MLAPAKMRKFGTERASKLFGQEDRPDFVGRGSGMECVA
jgi:hypothetical protein